MESWVDLLINSAIQMIVFAFIALSFSSDRHSEVAQFILLGMILWNIIWVSQYSITVGALWEIWSKSFSGLFMTPLTIEEFLVAQMLSSAIKAIVAFLLTAAIGFFIYEFSIFSLGSTLIIYALLLLVFGWMTGIFVLSLIIRFGTEVQALSWTLVFLAQPFGGVFYPISILPKVVQLFARVLPVSYVFESARTQLTTGVVRYDFLGIAFILDIVYLIGSYLFLKRTLVKSKADGRFARLES
jgi:ABC-2 type transport system permease protein